jgi:hypothetical protein
MEESTMPTKDKYHCNISNDSEAITSYHAGLVAEVKLLNGFAIQPELLYSTQGANYKMALMNSEMN